MYSLISMDKGLIAHTVICNPDGRVLIIRRSKQIRVLPGYWDLPGGTVEDGEDPADAAIREIKEETDLDVTNVSLYFEKSTVDKSKNKQFVTLVFFAKHFTGEVRLRPDGHEEHA